MVKLHFLGTSNAFGADGRSTSCYLLEGSKTILVDAGYSTLPNLRRIQISQLDLDAILISHLHPDHMIGLPQFVIEGKYVEKRPARLPVYGPVGLEQKVKDLVSVMYNEEVLEYTDQLYEFHEYGPDKRFSIPGGEVETLEALHTGNARMQIITLDQRTIGYTGDTSYHRENFAKLVKCNLMITETTSAEHFIPDHTTVKDLENLQTTSTSRIYLSHIGQSVIDIKDQIKPPFYLPADGMVVEV